jgi:hypothetical protein
VLGLSAKLDPRVLGITIIYYPKIILIIIPIIIIIIQIIILNFPDPSLSGSGYKIVSWKCDN